MQCFPQSPSNLQECLAAFSSHLLSHDSQNESHSENDRYWAPANPHEVVECKKAHGEKIMAWVGFVDGRCLPVVWFNRSVNGDKYLNSVLKGTVWPAVRNIATRSKYWFQQDGASSHVTTPCLDFLKEKFGDRLISRKTAHHWPPYSPDLSPLDFSFWNHVTVNMKKRQPRTLEDLKVTVENIASAMSEALLRKMAATQGKQLRSVFRKVETILFYLLKPSELKKKTLT